MTTIRDMRTQFYRVHSALLYNFPDLNTFHIAVYNALCELSWRAGNVYEFAASASDIAQLAHCSTDTVYKRCQELADMGILKVEQVTNTQGKQANTYTLFDLGNPDTAGSGNRITPVAVSRDNARSGIPNKDKNVTTNVVTESPYKTYSDVLVTLGSKGVNIAGQLAKLAVAIYGELAEPAPYSLVNKIVKEVQEADRVSRAAAGQKIARELWLVVPSQPYITKPQDLWVLVRGRVLSTNGQQVGNVTAKPGQVIGGKIVR